MNKEDYGMCCSKEMADRCAGQMEKDNAIGTILGMALTAIIIIGIKLFANYRNKNYQ